MRNSNKKYLISYGVSPLDRAKRAFWKTAIYPVFPVLRNVAVPFRIISGRYRRQRFPIGYLRKNRTARDFAEYLKAIGFIKHSIALKDPGQILSMRKLVGLKYQYHLRVFKDGEGRGHYEKTPECHAVAHLFQLGQEARTNDFLELLKGWIAKDEPE